MKSLRMPILFFWLYFFEGAPIGLIWWAIPTLMASNGTTADVITAMTAMATLPWSFKFFLGPVIDRFFFTVRSYAYGVALFQLLMIFCFVGLLLTKVGEPAFFAITVMISFVSATQDVIIDAWALGSVPNDRRGRVNGAMQAGLLSGRWLFGAGLLMLLAYVDWHLAIVLLCALLALSIAVLVVSFGRNTTCINPSAPKLTVRSFDFLFTRRFAVLTTIAVLTGFAFESFGAVVGPFLIANELDKQQVGLVLSINLLAMLLGALGGGRASDRRGARLVFLVSGFILCISVTLLGFLHLLGIGAILIGAVWLTYFFIGAFTAASYSYYMGQSKGPMEATRFTFLMAMTNLCEAAAAFLVGRWIAWTPNSYAAGFSFAAAVSLIGLIILARAKMKSTNRKTDVIPGS